MKDDFWRPRVNVMRLKGGSAKPKSVPDLPMSKLSTMPLATSTCLGQGVGIGSYVTNNIGTWAQVLTEFSNLAKLYDPNPHSQYRESPGSAIMKMLFFIARHISIKPINIP